MSELQICEFKVTKEDLSIADTGGSYRRVTVEIVIDKTLPIERQRECLLHEVLGSYLGSVIPTDTLEEIARSLNEALGELCGSP